MKKKKEKGWRLAYDKPRMKYCVHEKEKKNACQSNHMNLIWFFSSVEAHSFVLLPDVSSELFQQPHQLRTNATQHRAQRERLTKLCGICKETDRFNVKEGRREWKVGGKLLHCEILIAPEPWHHQSRRSKSIPSSNKKIKNKINSPSFASIPYLFIHLLSIHHYFPLFWCTPNVAIRHHRPATGCYWKLAL